MLWTFIFFYQPDKILLIFVEFFGVLPDLIPMPPLIIWDIKNGQPIRKIGNMREAKSIIPRFFYELYYLSHSFVTFGICFLIFYLFFDTFALVLLPWALHIFFDIFTHSEKRDIVRTRFLYPLSKFEFDGYSWQNRKALIINYTLIGIGLILRIFYMNCYIIIGV
ncbi:MAG: hypothetical protein ACTSO9_00675 [Candidatus Helarchaeota archaeon]